MMVRRVHTAMTSERGSTATGDRLKQLRAFCHTARLGSITRAAQYIFSSQPAVSQQVRALEDTLGITLFERSGPHLSLSWAGRQLYSAAMPVVMDMDRLPDTFVEQHHGEVSGEFHIAVGRAPAAYVMPDYLRRFQERYPDTRVKVRCGTGRDRLSWLRAYEVDIALGTVDVPPPDLRFHSIFASRHVLITPEDHPLARQDSVNLVEAAAHPVVMLSGDSYAQRIVVMLARQHGVVPRPAVYVDGWSIIKRYVEAGVGISIVPELCLTDRDRVSKIPFDHTFPDRKYGVFTRASGGLSLAAERFIAIMSPNFARRGR